MSNKDLIAAAFEKMMATMFIDDISVKDIMNECNLPRTVFYRYFHDKYDLMAYVYFNAIEKQLNNKTDYSYTDVVKVCYSYMYEKKSFFNKVVKYKNQNSFLQFLYEYSYKTTYDAICKSFHFRQLDNKSDCSLRLYCHGCTSLAEWWLETGLKMPVEQICEVIVDSVPICLKEYFDNMSY